MRLEQKKKKIAPALGKLFFAHAGTSQSSTFGHDNWPVPNVVVRPTCGDFKSVWLLLTEDLGILRCHQHKNNVKGRNTTLNIADKPSFLTTIELVKSSTVKHFF